MLVAYNALNVRPGVVDGATTYSINVLYHLPAALGANVLAYVQPGERRLDGVPGLELREVAAARCAGGRVLIDSAWLARSLTAERASALIAPYESLPLRSPCPVVVVAQNLAYHCDVSPSYLGSSVAQRTRSRAQRLYYRQRMRTAYRRAAAVVAVSETAAKILAARAGLDASRTTVVHEGADSLLLRAPGPPGVRNRNLLAISAIAPYKRLECAVDAVVELVRRGVETRLLIVGSGWRGYDRVLRRRVSATGADDLVEVREAVDPDMLVELYESSGALLQLSRCESFGLPLVEAMRHGLPVIAASNSSAPEIAAGAALLVDASDPGAVATAAQRVLDDAATADDLRRRGHARAAELTWAASAAGIAEVVTGAVARRPAGRR